ncbi:uncharacterized protein METZ01_LOCUS127132 [marine metagenome]|uniref:Uncharacterized protein n=1 Tax=marine metagenome TaxID=408172 RepID=A0A381YB73_9ZZZZ
MVVCVISETSNWVVSRWVISCALAHTISKNCTRVRAGCADNGGQAMGRPEFGSRR